MLVQSATGQRPGSTLYHVGDGFYFRVNRQHLKTVYMRCASPGCKVTGSMASDSAQRTHIKTAGQHNHPPDLFKYEMLAFSERLYQRCRVESTPLRTIFQEELAHAPSEIRPMLVMSHYLKRMQNLRKRLRAQSLRAKINLTTQDDSVLLYEDGTPIKDSGDEMSSSNNISLKGLHYFSPEVKEEENNDLKNNDSKILDEPIKMQGLQKKITTHGFDWTDKRMNVLLEAMRHYYPDVVRNKDNPKHVWEEVAKEINPDVKWYTVKKKWTQLEGGYRTYMKDLKETGDQGLYRPAYMEEVRDIINESEDLLEEVAESVSIDPSSDDVGISVEEEGDRMAVDLSDTVYNSDHLYTSLENIKQITPNRNDNAGCNTESKHENNAGLVKTLLKIHKEQLEESRRRMDAILAALEESRKESRETAQCIKRLTEAVIQRISTPGRIIVAQKRSHS
ncbi:uncharacterized protein isoform X2 [Rhodnius prolixus]|uniref:uncharacterized protein isoform X2 n=1 Tax=Rhodnius prolixus TaxID=13249 RepID=UPI003D18824C